MEKEKWAKPELVVLVEGKPEENVLTQCKSVHATTANAELSISGQNCKVKLRCSVCGACQAEGGGQS